MYHKQKRMSLDLKAFQMSKTGNSVVNENVSNSGYLDRFSRFVDENKRPITYALYGVSAVGGLIILRSLRVFRQFKSVKDVPEEFIENNYSIFGYVEKSEVVLRNKCLVPRISLTHIPISGKLRKDENCQIPVVISGIGLHPGFSLLVRQTMIEQTLNNKVKVTIFGKSGDELEGRVCLKKFGLWNNCLGETLLKQGFAAILKGEFWKSETHSLVKYRCKLEKQEAYARTNKIGMWRAHIEEAKKPSFLEKILINLKFK